MPEESDDREYATAEEVQRARAEYGSDNIEIDEPAKCSVGNDGVWVQAWVLLENDDA